MNISSAKLIAPTQASVIELPSRTKSQHEESESDDSTLSTLNYKIPLSTQQQMLS